MYLWLPPCVVSSCISQSVDRLLSKVLQSLRGYIHHSSMMASNAVLHDGSKVTHIQQ